MSYYNGSYLKDCKQLVANYTLQPLERIKTVIGEKKGWDLQVFCLEDKRFRNFLLIPDEHWGVVEVDKNGEQISKPLLDIIKDGQNK